MHTAPTASSALLDPRRKRILFRATHRGTHENDLMIGGWLAPRLAGMADEELAAVEAMLELPDPDLAEWLSGRRTIPPAQDSALLRRMRAAAAAPHPQGGPTDEPTGAA